MFLGCCANYFSVKRDHRMFLKRLQQLLNLWLNGIVFVLFILGYVLYTSLIVVRFMQKKKILAALLALCVAVVVTVTVVIYQNLRSVGTNHPSITLVIEPHTSLRTIADSLVAEKVITSSHALLIWMRLKGWERKVQAGEVTLGLGDGVLKASEKLLHAVPIEFRVTIPEGLTIEQTAGRIAQTIPIDTVLFSKICFDSLFIASLGIQAQSLEGYLFPETYRFSHGVNEKKIIEKMVHAFVRTWSSIHLADLMAKRYSRHQVVTLASIVEREATLTTEQPHIAGVFHNRLVKGYPLGADPTVRYALKKFSGPLRVSELNSPSPYNTRRFPGLPPGPICSPGKGALMAAAEPLETRDLYFVAKWDGSGEHDFSKTNEEHDRKKMQIRRYNERRNQEKRGR